VRLLCRHVHTLGFARVDIFVHQDNQPSQRVTEAAGFKRERGRHTVSRLGDGAVYICYTSS
jgi:RimJ/RimL family protein N-acetyltransferase